MLPILAAIALAPQNESHFESIGKSNPMKEGIEEIAVSPSGRYAAISSVGAFQLISIESGTTDTWDFDTPIEGICFRGENAYLFKTNGSVQIMDCKTHDVKTWRKLTDDPRYPYVNSAGTKFYYTMMPEGKRGLSNVTFVCFDVATKKAQYRLTNFGPLGMCDVTSDGKRVVGVRSSAPDAKGRTRFSLSVYDVAKKSFKKFKEILLGKQNVGQSFTSCRFSQDGQTVLCSINTTLDKTGKGNADLESYDVATGRLQRTYHFPNCYIGGQLSFQAGGKNVLFQNDDDIVSFNLATGKPNYKTPAKPDPILPIRASETGNVVICVQGKQLAIFRAK